jgi:ABC-type lipoprotein release transport system permease subunit
VLGEGAPGHRHRRLRDRAARRLGIHYSVLGDLYSPTLLGIVATLVIGGLAGFYPSVRAARQPPTEALGTT